MASTFKQQCPSCEAMVPIRDPGLIGRKIDCPTCKYRFVVEEPADQPDEDLEDAKPRKGKPAAPAKAKSTGRRRDEDEDEDRPKSKDGGSTKLVVGGLAAVVGVGLIAVAVYFGFIHDGGSTPAPAPRPTPPSVASGTPAPTPQPTPEQGGGGTEAAVARGGRGGVADDGGGQPTQPAATMANPGDIYGEITNLLPGDSEGVIHVPFKNLASAAVGRLIFDPAGGFSRKDFEARSGINPDDIDRFVQAINFKKPWTYHVLKTTAPLDWEKIKQALQLKNAPGGGEDYLLTDSSDWVDMLLRYKSVLGVTRLGPLAVRRHDAQTLIFGDVEPVKALVAAGGKFPAVHKGPYLALTPGGATPQAGTPGTPAPQAQVPNELGTAGGGSAVGIDLNRQPTPQGAPGATDPQQPVRPYYLTVPAELKAMLDRLEERPTLATMAFDTRVAGKNLERFIPTFHNLAVLSGFGANEIQKGRIFGLAVQQLRNGLSLSAFLNHSDVASSRELRKTLQDHAPKLAALLETAFGVKATVVQDQNEPAPDAPPGTAAPGGGIGDDDRGARLGGGGRGGAPLELGVGGGGGVPGAGRVGGQPDQPAASASTIEPRREERLVMLKVNLVFDDAGHQKLATAIQQHIRQLRGDQDMAAGQLRWHEVGAAAQAERDKKGGAYPRGTFPREAGPARAGVPYLPNQRLSWMATLLPHLGHDLHLNMEKSWDDKDNLPAASILVPQFLDPRSPRSTWWVRYPGMTQDVAATHVVGMAGIGVDAAEYAADDPNLKGKLGVFGYDRVTKLTEITDGASHTIMMIQVPPTFKRPWLAGGGATVMGVPDPPPPSQKSVTPFVSTSHGGRQGTMVILADGSVRFVPADTPDGVFKAMCTTQGGDEKFLDRDVPLVKAPETVATVSTASRPTSIGKPVGGALGDWKEFTSTEGEFSVLMPGDPKKENKPLKASFGETEICSFVVERPTDTYRVSYVDIPSSLARAAPTETLLDDLGVLGVKASGGKVVKEDKITVGGLPAREMVLDFGGKIQARFRIIVVNRRHYQLMIGGTPDTVASTEADKFLTSFKPLSK